MSSKPMRTVKSDSIDVFMPESFIAEELSNLQDKFIDVELPPLVTVADVKLPDCAEP